MVDFDSMQDDVAPAAPQDAARTPSAAPSSFDSLQDDEEKYGTPLEMAKTAAEGLGKGIAGPLFTGAETALLGNRPEQLAREEANPIAHGAGEMTGLVGGAMLAPEVTLGGALSAVGTATKAIPAVAGLGKIGSAIVGSAIENMVYQGQDEVGKLLLKDPGASTDTALLSMGLAGLIGGAAGGAFGAIPPLWHATMGKQTGGVLSAIADKLGGIEGAAVDPAADTIARSGMNIAPEVQALASKNPAVQEMARTLQQTDTNASGRAAQEAYRDAERQAGSHMVRALGKTPEEVAKMPEVSAYTYGKKLATTLSKEYDERMSPLAQGFDEIKGKLKNVELPVSSTDLLGVSQPGTVDTILDRISQRAIEEGWTTMPSSDIMSQVDKITKELPLQKNLKNLGDYISQVGKATRKDPMNGPLRSAGGIMTSIMKDAEGEAMASHIGSEAGPDAVEHLRALQEGYRVQSALKEGIADRLGMEDVSTSGYGAAIRETASTDAEGALRKLSGKDDADWLDFVQKHYPNTAAVLKDYHTNDLLEKAAGKAKEGAVVNNAELLKILGNMSLELRNFVATPEAQQSITGIGAFLDSIKNPNYNFSNTGRTGASLLKGMGSTAMSAATALSGHGLGVSALVGFLSKTIGSSAPDAVRLALLRFLGSGKPIEAGAFKTMVDYIHHTVKGETLLSNAAKNIFKAGTEVIPAHMMPTESDRNKISKVMENVNKDPTSMNNVGGKTGYYLPTHQGVIAQTAANSVRYLAMQKPNIDRASPLDSQRMVSPLEKAQYARTTNLMQQPLLVFKHIQDGTLTPGDVATVKANYPGFYDRSVQKLNQNMTTALSKGATIPYKTKMGLSLYMGQALDSTMQPASIVAAQPMPAQAQPQTAMQPASNPKRSTSSLSKMPKMYRTAGQSAEEDRMDRK